MRLVRSIPLFLGFAAALQASTVASACRVGGDTILFIEVPSPQSLPNAQTIRVHFTNVGPLVDEWRKRQPWRQHEGALGGTLIGVGRLLVGKRSDYFAVYASVTSCTHGFWSMAFGKAEPVWNGEYYLVGRFRSDKGRRYFQAAGNWNGRWHF